jgi:hypothetical protein
LASTGSKRSIDKDYANYMADYNRDKLGINVIPADTQTRAEYPNWRNWQDKPISQSQHEEWKATGAFSIGMARIHGRIWHRSDLERDTYWFSVDCDNHAAIDLMLKVFSATMDKEYKTLDDLSDDFLVEFHADQPDRAHISGYTEKPLTAKSSDAGKFKSKIEANEIPAIEIKSQGKDGISFSPPSYHKHGHPYEAKKKTVPETLNITQASKLMLTLDFELSKFGINYLIGTAFRKGSKKSMPSMEEMRKPEFKVTEGHNRHECVLRIFESNLFTKTGIWNDEQIKDDGIKWNQEHCVPPLSDKQIEGQWNDAKIFYEKHKNDNSTVSSYYDVKQEQEQELAKIQLTQADYNFLFDTLKPEAKYDVRATKQLSYGFFSAYTNTPFVISVNAPSGSGKNHDIDIVADLFPKEDTIRLGGISDKALFHSRGIQVIKNDKTGEYEPVEPSIAFIDEQIQELENAIEDLGDTDKQLIREKKRQKDELERKKKDLLKHSQKLIDFINKILIIEDTPKMSLLENLAPLLGQNSQEKEYVFTDRKSSQSSLEAKRNVLRGCPAFISAQAVDYSHYERFAEINRRMMPVNPNLSSQKVAEAIRVQSLKWGATRVEYEDAVIAQEDKEKARKIVLIICTKLKQLSKHLGHKESGVFIPYKETLQDGLPKSDLWHITNTDRLFRYLTMSTRVHCDCRPKIVYPDGRIELIATFDDLREALYLMQGSSPDTGVSPYRLEWFEKVFSPLYRSKANVKASGKDSHGNSVEETHVGVTTDELLAKDENKNLTSKELLQRYLYPLQNQGIIDGVKSEINRNHNIFFPTPAAIKESFFHSFMDKKNESFDNLRFKVINPQAYPTIDVLEMQIMSALKHSSEGPVSVQENNSSPKIFDETCKIQKNARMIVEEAFSFPDRYFAKGWLDDNHSEDGGERGSKYQTLTSGDNSSVAVAKSVRPRVAVKNKNEIDPVQLELLLSLVE